MYFAILNHAIRISQEPTKRIIFTFKVYLGAKLILKNASRDQYQVGYTLASQYHLSSYDTSTKWRKVEMIVLCHMLEKRMT